MSVSASSFSNLLAVHARLDEVLSMHQQALLLLDISAARELLAIYREVLALHMRHEEEVVLPLFDRAGLVKKWPRILYTGQHEKMRGHLSSIAGALEALATLSPVELPAAAVAVLDLETTYKHLGEHHDGAEREGLFPITDGVVGDDERTGVVQGLLDETEQAFLAHAERVAALRIQLRERTLRALSPSGADAERPWEVPGGGHPSS